MTAPYTPILPDLTNDGSVFPFLPGQGFLSSKSPMWSTAIATATSGRERSRQNWSYPKWLFKLKYEVLRDNVAAPELARLFGFFNSHAGRAIQFSYFDPDDNLATNCPFGVGDGASKTFQLIRQGGVGAMTFLEPVRSVLGTPKVSVGATDTTAFTLGPRGAITFTAAPASGQVLTWSGQFMFLVRFNQDQLDPEQLMAKLWALSGLELISVKR